MCRFEFFGKLLQKVTSGKVTISDALEAMRVEGLPECTEHKRRKEQPVPCVSEQALGTGQHSIPHLPGCR